MSSTPSLFQEVLAASNRRSFLRRAGLAGLAGAVAPALAPLFVPAAAQAAPTPSPELDFAILNFALNLEYLEAQYYTYAVTGGNIEAQKVGTDGGDGTAAGTVTIKDGAQVPFADPTVAAYAQEIATDERNHVAFLRSALGANAVAQPDLDLLNSFTALGQLAGLGDNFDPFADDVSFLLGAFIFEDVGVSAYHGASPLIFDVAKYIPAAAGILAVEAFHASTVRAILFNLAQVRATQDPLPAITNPNPPPPTQIDILGAVEAISRLRDSVDNKKDKDQGITNGDGSANIAPTDANGLAFARSTNQVLRIVYGMTSSATTTPSPGTFFPNRMNGVIR